MTHKAMRKWSGGAILEIDGVLDAVLELRNKGKFERSKAWGVMKAINSPLLNGAGVGLQDFMPSGGILRPLEHGEVRFKDPVLNCWCVRLVDGKVVRELPGICRTLDMAPDRESASWAALMYL